MFETLDDKFDVTPTIPEKEESDVVASSEITSDEELSRMALRVLIETGGIAVKDAHNLAFISQSPRAYEVLAQLIKTVSDSSKDLLVLQKIKKDIGKKDAVGPRTQNNLFVGSTTELMKVLKKNPLEILPPVE